MWLLRALDWLSPATNDRCHPDVHVVSRCGIAAAVLVACCLTCIHKYAVVTLQVGAGPCLASVLVV